jgi:beta-lactamase regulating signal transducer with metallopeptidase domain
VTAAVLLVKASCVLALGLASMPLLRRGAAATRHAVLLTSLAAAAIVPLLIPVAPGWGGDIAGPHEWPLASGSSSHLLVWVWAAGAVFNLTVLAAGLSRLLWVSSRAEEYRDQRLEDLALDIAATYRLPRPVSLRQSDCALTPLTWGHLRPKVLLPPAASSWDDERARMVLRHELAHIRRADWLTQVIASLVRAAFWWHPLVWFVASRLRRESELACDAHAIEDGVPASRYSWHLLELARGVSRHEPGAALGMASASGLESRVRRLLDPRANHASSTSGGVRGMAASAFLAVAVVIAGYGSHAWLFDPPTVVVVPSKPVTLTLLLDGRLVDLSKYVPPAPLPDGVAVRGTTMVVVSPPHQN